MRLRDAATVAIVLTVAVLSAGFGSGQTATHISDRKIDDVSVENLDLQKAIRSLARDKRIPIGLEVLPDNKLNSAPVSLRLERATVGEIVDKLLANDPRYHWREIEGVIDIAPLAHDPLLETIVEHFDVKRKAKSAALDELGRAPELQAAFRESDVRLRTFLSIAGQVPDSDTKRFS